MHQGPAFFTGLAAGVLVVGAAWWMLGLGMAPEPAPGTPSVGDAATPDDDRALRAEIDRLRQELARTQGGERSALEATATTDQATPAAGHADADDAPRRSSRQTDDLLAEFHELLRSGAAERWLEVSPEEFLGFLLQQWVLSGRPDRALALLERVEPDQQTASFAFYIGEERLEAGDTAAATRAFLAAMRGEPENWAALIRLLDHAPDAALQARDALATPDAQSPDFIAQNALLLLAVGRRDEGLAAIDRLLAAGVLPGTAWEQLVQRDPAAAEARLRQQRKQGDDEDGTMALRIAAALRNQGRNAEAVHEIEGLLRSRPDDLTAIEALADTDRGRAIEWLEGRLAVAPSPDSWSMYGEQLLTAERTEEGIGAIWQAWELGTGREYAERLLQLAPARIAPRLLVLAATNDDDELFGDVADALWQLGRREEARAHWQRALRIDPTDSEWSDKLRAVADGHDPLN